MLHPMKGAGGKETVLESSPPCGDEQVQNLATHAIGNSGLTQVTYSDMQLFHLDLSARLLVASRRL